MTRSDSTVEVVWPAPAGGRWELETVHAPGGQPRVFQEHLAAPFKAGFRAIGITYGLPLDYLDVRFVNDHCYARMRPVGAPDPKPGKTGAPPPALVLKVLTRVHPELRRRARTAKRVLAGEAWHHDLERWERELRPALTVTGRALQAEPIDEFSDEMLVDHLDRVLGHFEHGCAVHFEMMPVHNIPVGRLLLATRRWGLDDGEILALLAGSSPASLASRMQLGRIAALCASAGVEPDSLDDIRGAGVDAAEALDEYLADHAWRIVTQYTPRGLAMVEMPAVLVRAIRAAGEEALAPDTAAPDPAEARRRVPLDEQGTFDALLADARRCYGIRDDNVALTFMWPVGLMRRALLEIGARLALKGAVAEVSHAFTLDRDELGAALAGSTDPATVAVETAARVGALRTAEADGAPAFLGDDEGPPPDPNLFPPGMAELTQALVIGFELEVSPPDEPMADEPMADEPAWTGRGSGIGRTPYRGRACVAEAAEDALTRLQPGDVLVTGITTPAFEAVMAIAGAVVTDHGGLMSHTAIVCREHAIPAVVGVSQSTRAIVDGDLVTVDPAAGRVHRGHR